MYHVIIKLTSGQNTRINTVNVWNESVNNTVLQHCHIYFRIHSKIKIDNRDTQPPLKWIPMSFPSSFKGVCQKQVIVVTLTSLIWPGDVFLAGTVWTVQQQLFGSVLSNIIFFHVFVQVGWSQDSLDRIRS